MKKAHFTDSQILATLKQVESGMHTSELCREHGMGSSTKNVALIPCYRKILAQTFLLQLI